MLFKNKWVHDLCKHFTYRAIYMKEHSAKISIVCFNICKYLIIEFFDSEWHNGIECKLF